MRGIHGCCRIVVEFTHLYNHSLSRLRLTSLELCTHNTKPSSTTTCTSTALWIYYQHNWDSITKVKKYLCFR